MYITNISLANNLSEHEQYLCLSISQCITLNVVAVVVEINSESTAKHLSVSIRQRLQSVPLIHYIFYFFHICAFCKKLY